MTWVNLDDVYVSTNGGTISGDLTVNGTLTCKNGSTTYNVGSQLATLGDSVSPTVLARLDANPQTYPISVTVPYNVDDFNRLAIYGITGEYKRCYVELVKSNRLTFNSEYFTLMAYNSNYGDDNPSLYLKCSDFKINIANDKKSTEFTIYTYNEIGQYGATGTTTAKKDIGVSIYAILGYKNSAIAKYFG